MEIDPVTDVIWLPCDFDGCKRQENGDCDHCGFHAGQMELLEAIGQKKQADAIKDKYTLPVSEDAIFAKATRCSEPIGSVSLSVDPEMAAEIGADWKLGGSAALRIEEINENIRNALINANRLVVGNPLKIANEG